MKRNTFSPTYVNLLDLLFKIETNSTNMHQIRFENGRFSRTDTGVKSQHLSQDFYMAASELWAACTPHEWYLAGRIASELKSYNALWECTDNLKNNSSNRKAIKGLINKNVLIKTETTDIYLVNPFYIRRGDFTSVITTTANALSDHDKVRPEDVTDHRAIRDFKVHPLQLPQ